MSNLIECIDCGKQVSKRATTCPNCGAPVKLTIAEIEKPKKSYTQIEQEKLEAKLGVKKKSEYDPQNDPQNESPVGRYLNSWRTSKNKKIHPLYIILIAVVGVIIFHDSVYTISYCEARGFSNAWIADCKDRMRWLF